ncbi:MAG: ATP-binding protein [Candidatus Competibacterales bacterium]
MPLFWRLFLGFWLAAVLAIGTGAWLSTQLLRQEWPTFVTRRLERELTAYAATAELLLETGGPPALERWLERLPDRRRGPLLIFDQRGRELFGRPWPHHPESPVVRRIQGTTGLYDLVLPFPPPWERRRGWTFWRRWDTLAQLASAIAASGLFAGGVARHLTRPIQALRATTQRLAAGDLTVRVGHNLPGRWRELDQLGRDVDRMAVRLEALLAAQRRLLRDVSHELRSPLARLQIALGLAQRRCQGGEAELARIAREADRLGSLVDQLLSLIRLESGTEPLACETVDLTALLADIVADGAFEGAGERTVAGDIQDGLSLWGNANILHSAVENLVRNALQHTPPGTAVQVKATTATPGAVVIQVIDGGPGVPEADLGQLFDPFYRVADARDRRSGGFGLGLAIAARAVAAHGGTIHAWNAPPTGLGIQINLPPSPRGHRA